MPKSAPSSLAFRSRSSWVAPSAVSASSSTYTAPKTLPSVILTSESNPDDEATLISSGPLAGYEHVLYPKSEDMYYFCKRLSAISDERFFVYLCALPNCMSQVIALKWNSDLLLPPGEPEKEHRLEIDVTVPWREWKKGHTTMRLTLAEESQVNPEVKKVQIELPGKYTRLSRHDHTFAAKVRQLNQATATSWFPVLVTRLQLAKAKNDKTLLAEKDRINGLLEGYLSKLWE
jgi:hypothetical protein